MSGTLQSSGLALQAKEFEKLRTSQAVSALRVQGPGEFRQLDIQFNDPTLEVWLNLDAQDMPKASPEKFNSMGFRRPRVGGWWVAEFAALAQIYTLSYTAATPITFNNFMEIKIRNRNKVVGATMKNGYCLFQLLDPQPQLREDGAPQPRADEDDI